MQQEKPGGMNLRILMPAVLVLASLILFASERIGFGNASVAGVTSASAPPAKFKWSMPKRFGQMNADGIVDFHWNSQTRKYDDSYVNPGSWRVKFDANDLVAPVNSTYQWEIDGTAVSQPTTTATLTHEFTEQRTYDVKLTVTVPDGTQTIVQAPVTVKDLLIVSIGDSFASGQGNPDIPKQGQTPAKWVDRPCARSADAGPAQAARSIEEADPHTSVTFVSLACTGAKIKSGLLETQVEGGVQNDPQIAKLQETLNGRKIDALLMSIGGNDLGFSKLVAHCIVGDCADSKGAKKIFDEGLASLEPGYKDLNDKLMSLPTAKIFITEYPDIVRDEQGEFCNLSPKSDWLGLIKRSEARWASETVIAELNKAVKAAADKYGWTYVGGVADKFRTHGYCAPEKERWVRTFREARRIQGGASECPDLISLTHVQKCIISLGAVHPNRGGHAAYATRLIEELQLAGVTKPPVP
jgi:PKD repeat protein